jgi:hypothetical protein
MTKGKNGRKIRMLRVLTIPGVWDAQKPEEFVNFSQRYPFVEWGLKFHGGDYQEIGFPSKEWIEELADRANDNVRIALHLDAEHARMFCLGEIAAWDILSDKVWSKVRRINIPIADMMKDDRFEIDIPSMMDLFQNPKFSDHPQGFRCCSFQTKTEESSSIVWEIMHYINDAYCLFDLQDELKLPKQWPMASFPDTNDGYVRAHGYAANFTGPTVKEHIRGIMDAANKRPFWLQTEKYIFEEGVINGNSLRAISDPVSPHYQHGCCREKGSPVRIQYTRLNEKEWH